RCGNGARHVETAAAWGPSNRFRDGDTPSRGRIPMRKAAWVALLVIAAAVVALTRTTPAGGQDDAQNTEETRAGYGRRWMLTYEQELGESARNSLVRLRSRYVVADAACPVPSDAPTMPFYVRLNGPMPPEFAARLKAA